MKKPGWISFMGWAFLALWAFTLGACLLSAIEHEAVLPPVTWGLAMVLSVPCLGLWALGSIVCAFQRHGAHLRASANLRSLVGDAGTPHIREAASRARKGMVPAIGELRCSVCGGDWPVVFCQRHQASLCGVCMSRHDPRAECEYQILRGAGGAADSAVRSEEARPQSPLGLTEQGRRAG